MVDGPNLYAYAGNNPVRFADPSGNCIAAPGIPCGSQKYFQSGFYCPSCSGDTSSSSGSDHQLQTVDCMYAFCPREECYFDYALFALTVGAALLGLYFEYSRMVVAAAMITIANYDADVLGMGVAFGRGDPFSIVLAVGGFVWDHLPQILGAIKFLVNSFFGWLGLGFSIAAKFNPVSWPVTVALATGSILIGVGSLAASGCL